MSSQKERAFSVGKCVLSAFITNTSTTQGLREEKSVRRKIPTLLIHAEHEGTGKIDGPVRVLDLQSMALLLLRDYRRGSRMEQCKL